MAKTVLLNAIEFPEEIAAKKDKTTKTMTTAAAAADKICDTTDGQKALHNPGVCTPCTLKPDYPIVQKVQFWSALPAAADWSSPNKNKHTTFVTASTTVWCTQSSGCA